jgi:small-conductance mechanosensitive channel/CRP-like cAMP-binding protein
MSLLPAILEEGIRDQTLPLFLGVVLTAALLGAFAPLERRRLRSVVFLFALHLLLVPICALLLVAESSFYSETRFVCLLFGALAAVQMAGALMFNVLLPALRLQTPRILRDVLLAAGAIIAFFVLASRLGFNLSGLIATSAVLTAIIGFSLQDTLGNIMGGLSLQLDNSVQVGDWIKTSDNLSGKVIEIRWRHTAVETRNWETVIIPNSILMKGQVVILGRRLGQPLQWRRWVHFNVDFRYQPSDVIAAVEQTLCNAPIANIAAAPRPNCILMSLEESYGKYAVRYWLTDLAVDDPTDSEVRTRIYFALQRARIPLSIPAHAVFMTEDTGKRKERKARAETDRRIQALAQVDLFRSMSDAERQQIAESLLYAPYTKNEIVTKQGAEAHWLYLIVDGRVSVRVAANDGREREVTQMDAPAVIGEMSLMTGETRGATVVALTDVECYRLERSAFRNIVNARPELAEHLAHLLAQRRTELAAAKEDLDQEAQVKRLAADKITLLGSIREFFGLSD